MPVTIEAIREARAHLAGIARVTPVLHSRHLAERVGGPVWLKCENLQVAGSFKVRGAYTRLSRLDPDERARGVVAASAGNHAQGVAVAAGHLGIRATVFMPQGAPLPKVSATRAYGADVQFVGETIDDALAAAHEFADRTGAVMIHPFDHEDIVTGQGTLGLEIVEQRARGLAQDELIGAFCGLVSIFPTRDLWKIVSAMSPSEFRPKQPPPHPDFRSPFH